MVERQGWGPTGAALAFALGLAAGVLQGIGALQAGQRQRPAASPLPLVRPTGWAEAQPLVERLHDALPQSLAEIAAAERPARWAAWLEVRRQSLASRIAQGDVDSVVNLLLFGTSFTSQPRITATLLRELDQRWKAGDRAAQDTLRHQYQQRAADLVAAAANPRAGE